MFRIEKGVLALGIPAALSFAAVFRHSALLFILLVLAHFIIIKAIPSFRGHENIWMFLIVAVSSAPVNIYILVLLNEWDILFSSIFILGIMRCILYYAVLFSVEEIIMGVVTRLIWRKQYRPDL